MSIISYILIGLLMGIIFGFLLEKGRVFEPGIIVGQFQMRTFTMLKVMLTAIITGMLFLALATTMGWVALGPKAAVYGATILGGSIMGAGIALAGACPGTILAQIGAGYKDAWMTLVGALAGGIAYGYMAPFFKSTRLFDGGGKITLEHVTGICFPFLALWVAFALAVLLYFLERKSPWEEEVGEDHDGM